MANYGDPQLMANALAGGAPAPRIDEIIPHVFSNGTTFNDQPTDQQRERTLLQRSENMNAANNPMVPTVLPPSVLTDDRSVGTVFPDNPQNPKLFHPGNFLPPSYGAGRYKIYTPNMVVPPIPGDAIAQLIEKLNKKK